MRKLVAILKEPTRTLKIFESKNKLRGEVYKDGALVMSADFYIKDNDATEYRVCEYFNFKNFYRVPFERKNGKIVLYPINKQRRIIWTNDDYDEWLKCMIADMEEGESEEDFDYDRYHEDCSLFLDDERTNLDVEVDGYIVCFASLGLWNGIRNGAKLVGTNVKDILYDNCDFITWYCDVHNVRCDASHHDGTNHYLYRVADTKEKAERLIEKIAFKDMSEEEFRRATKSLRPYVAKVYGW